MSRKTVLNISLVTIVIVLLGSSIQSCRKDDSFITDPSAKLHFSTDTIIFDTVFSTIGSMTELVKVYNKENQDIKISSIRLAGGASSSYQMNVDGEAGSLFSDIELKKDDSLYIFVRVTVDPNDQSNPFLVSDSIIFETNGNLQDVKLVAYGQNAHFWVNTIYQADGIWENDKPHVIYGFVIIDSSYSLTIREGAQLHFHKDAVLAVANEGSLRIEGSRENPVVLQGDRLEDNYEDLPGQWYGLWLSAGSVDNSIDWAVIQNATVGIRVDTLGNSPNPTLTLNNSIIQNMTGFGLLAQGSNVIAANSVFANCAQSCVLLNIGGTYDFRHCTIANYYNYDIRQSSALVINNYYLLYDDDGVFVDTIARDLDKAYFGNCIVYGNADEEKFFSKTPRADFSYEFENCLLKTTSIGNGSYSNCIKNQDPLFSDYYLNDYTLDTLLSPAVNAGSMEIVNNSVLNIAYDLLGNSRTADEAPDLGAYELDESR